MTSGSPASKADAIAPAARAANAHSNLCRRIASTMGARRTSGFWAMARRPPNPAITCPLLGPLQMI
eukprot:5204580-Pyramimonas_sp.AAC.1